MSIETTWLDEAPRAAHSQRTMDELVAEVRAVLADLRATRQVQP